MLLPPEHLRVGKFKPFVGKVRPISDITSPEITDRSSSGNEARSGNEVRSLKSPAVASTEHFSSLALASAARPRGWFRVSMSVTVLGNISSSRCPAQTNGDRLDISLQSLRTSSERRKRLREFAICEERSRRSPRSAAVSETVGTWLHSSAASRRVKVVFDEQYTGRDPAGFQTAVQRALWLCADLVEGVLETGSPLGDS